MSRIVSAIVNNHPGVLNRITGMFLRKNFNIQSITVGTTEVDGLSRMTFVIGTDDSRVMEQVTKQLHKQIDVIKVNDITDQPIVARELVLIKVFVPPAQRAEVNHLIDPFRATTIDVGRETITVEATGKSEKIEALIALLRPYGIQELARTGLTAFTRDQSTVSDGMKMGRNSTLVI